MKIQKHQSFEAEIAAHTNSMMEVKNKGKKMMAQDHFAAEAIKVLIAINLFPLSYLFYN